MFLLWSSLLLQVQREKAQRGSPDSADCPRARLYWWVSADGFNCRQQIYAWASWLGTHCAALRLRPCTACNHTYVQLRFSGWSHVRCDSPCLPRVCIARLTALPLFPSLLRLASLSTGWQSWLSPFEAAAAGGTRKVEDSVGKVQVWWMERKQGQTAADAVPAFIWKPRQINIFFFFSS